MDSAQPPVRATILVGCAIVVGLVVDVWTDGPPGIGFLLAATVAGLGLLTVIGLNLLDPEAFIAERNIARVAREYELDTRELASLSADAAPAIAEALPELAPSIRERVERDLACLRAELRREVMRFGWASFNLARDVALERLNPLSLPGC